MPKYAYKDASGDVITCASSQPDAAAVRTLITLRTGDDPGALTCIEGVPDAIAPKLDPRAEQYHRHDSGDGSDVAHYSLQDNPVALDAAKAAREDAIDQRTMELIVSGYSHNGRVFSASPTAQRNLKVTYDERGNLSYPFHMATKNNREIYPLADADEVAAMYQVGLSTVITHYQSGNALKSQILAATTIAAVNAIEDNR